jgi:hypothetical protein
MSRAMRGALAIFVLGVVAVAAAALFRIVRVTRAAAIIPVYPGARESGGRTRYFPRLLSWDDRSSARIQRVFALPESTSLITIARHADATLVSRGWYLVMPDDLERILNPQVIVWQRDPDERLDLTQLWPLPGMTPTQRMYGGVFPREFLDAPIVIEWNWALNGPRSSRPVLAPPLIVRPPPPPQPRGRK